MTDTRKNRLLRTMLFSGLGIFACLLLGNYTNLPPEAVARLGIWWVYLFFIVIFCSVISCFIVNDNIRLYIVHINIKLDSLSAIFYRFRFHLYS